jgi:Rrf2 family cysteine metabolism transcriptional repressor
LTDLAVHYGQGPTPCADIAERQAIPLNYLNQLLIPLRDAGLIRSTRGPNGGHELARPPEQITLSAALEVLEGPLVPSDCLIEPRSTSCELSARCRLRGVWEEVRAATERILNSKTLLDLLPEGGARP